MSARLAHPNLDKFVTIPHSARGKITIVTRNTLEKSGQYIQVRYRLFAFKYMSDNKRIMTYRTTPYIFASTSPIAIGDI